MQATCSHLDQLGDVGPGANVCETCVKIGGTWLHLRQCLVCGLTGCCDSSPNKHASGHFRETGHPIMRSLEEGEDWGFCFADDLTMRPGPDGQWRVVDPFFEAGVWYARQALESGASLPFAPDAKTDDEFPLGVWETTFRGRHREGTIDPDQAAELEALPGWRW